jgi:hypothetical protein
MIEYLRIVIVVSSLSSRVSATRQCSVGFLVVCESCQSRSEDIFDGHLSLGSLPRSAATSNHGTGGSSHLPRNLSEYYLVFLLALVDDQHLYRSH